MRAGPAMRIESASASALGSLRLGWRQAGFSSFAYRLAHLRAWRPVVVGGLSMLFFIA